MDFLYYAIDGLLIFSLLLFLLPFFSSWALIIPDGIEIPILDSLHSLQYKVSIYCSIAVSIPMILELSVRVVLEPKLLTDFKTFISNVFLVISLLLPDLIILIFVIPNGDLKVFNLAFEGRFLLSVWSLGKFLYRFGDDGFFQSIFSISIFAILCINRILVYYSYYFNFSNCSEWVTELTMYVGFLMYGTQIIRWFRYINKISTNCYLSTDQYLCNIYIISATLVFFSMLILYLILNPSLNWLQTDADYLSGSTCIFSIFYVLITIFQGRALQREAVIFKVRFD